MQLFNTVEHAKRIDQLIRLKATGSPSELAKKLDICERQVYRLIQEFKDSGLPICYCKRRQTYYYASEVIMKFEVSVIENGQIRKIIGGEEKKYSFYDIFFQTDILRQLGY